MTRGDFYDLREGKKWEMERERERGGGLGLARSAEKIDSAYTALSERQRLPRRPKESPPRSPVFAGFDFSLSGSREK